MALITGILYHALFCRGNDALDTPCGTGTPAGACLLQEDTLHRQEYLHPPGEAPGRDPNACATRVLQAAEFRHSTQQQTLPGGLLNANCALLIAICSSIPLLLVHLTQQPLAVIETVQILRDEFVMALPQALGDAGGVGRDQNVVQRPERSLFRQWLFFEHIQGGTGDAASFKRINQSWFVSQRSATDVDQVGVTLHFRKAFSVHER